MHLMRNRGIFPSRKELSAMEVLIMTNGLLMTVPGSYSQHLLSEAVAGVLTWVAKPCSLLWNGVTGQTLNRAL